MNKSKLDQDVVRSAPKNRPNSNPISPGQLYATNNFHLIRLFAALQVAFSHLYTLLKIEDSGIVPLTICKIINLFPGVPIFFFVSGFLISKSYEKSSHLSSYFKNRTLRIYPALMLCVVLSVVSVYFSGYYGTINLPISKFIFWIFSQIITPGFYNPDFMRAYGSGVLDGPVWTISVEIQLYILIPVIYSLFFRFKKDINHTMCILIVVFSIISIIFSQVQTDENFKKSMFFKFLHISFLPWFNMFLFGVWFQINYAMLNKYLNGKIFYVLILYLVFSYILLNWGDIRILNFFSPIRELFLAIVIFTFAYSYTNLSNALLGQNDISYGIYLYHMPVCNYFIYKGWQHEKIYFLMAVLLSCIIAYISWMSLEKPALLLKQYSINPLNWKYQKYDAEKQT